MAGIDKKEKQRAENNQPPCRIVYGKNSSRCQSGRQNTLIDEAETKRTFYGTVVYVMDIRSTEPQIDSFIESECQAGNIICIKNEQLPVAVIIDTQVFRQNQIHVVGRRISGSARSLFLRP